ncbi:hypothetical protein D9758_010787 [Tetrapyrgos nigripes]|uniref:Mitochondrial splicing suppressor 51-like C-terminal domain-containing protein n=1 Tax=Tetrapyrgos nigripes TaxID=182062 RepID=A0A8H5FZF1_9AGAR|nr:hypothetical protein D9758_010787 [Tetrapyrgos nigripes]
MGRISSGRNISQMKKVGDYLIPFRVFEGANAQKRLVLITGSPNPVKDWDSWYKQRKISKGPTAALLMSCPLTVCQLVVNWLQVSNATRGGLGTRFPLHIDILGVEIEPNYLPLFSELVLLLPYRDVQLVIFVPCVHKLSNEVLNNKNSCKSLIGQSSTSSPIFSPIFS